MPVTMRVELGDAHQAAPNQLPHQYLELPDYRYLSIR